MSSGPYIMQPRLYSLFESCANIGLGYGIAVVSQVVIFPLFEIDVPLRTNMAIGVWFTAISLVRSYLLRRWFEWRWHHKKGGDA